MKLRKGDKVMVIAGRDRHKTGEVMMVLPKTNQVIVGGINQVKRHTKPDQKNPKGGILSVEKPLDVSKVMVVDPQSGKPARISYQVSANGEKTRVFKTSKFTAQRSNKAPIGSQATATDQKAKVKS